MKQSMACDSRFHDKAVYCAVNLPGNLFEYACETATEVHPERPWADIEAEFQAASLDSSI